MSFAEWITMRRKEKGLSQIEAAEKAQVAQSVWSDYEKSSNRNLRRSTVLKIADALGTPHSEALEAAGFQSCPADVPAEIVNMWHRVPASKRRAVMDNWRSVVDLVSV